MPVHVDKDGYARDFMGPEAVDLYRMSMLLHGMKVELQGRRLTAKAPSCFTIVKKQYKLKGTKQQIVDQFEKLLQEAKTKVEVVRDA